MQEIERLVDVAGDRGRAEFCARGRGAARDGAERQLVEGGLEMDAEAAGDAGVERAARGLDRIELEDEDARVDRNNLSHFRPFRYSVNACASS